VLIRVKEKTTRGAADLSGAGANAGGRDVQGRKSTHSEDCHAGYRRPGDVCRKEQILVCPD